jgi:hypothetical protein
MNPKTFTIVLKDMLTFTIEADDVRLDVIDDKVFALFCYDEQVIARINLNNIVGWIDSENYDG